MSEMLDNSSLVCAVEHLPETVDNLPVCDYEDLTELARVVCGVPNAFISLISEGRQVFKSRIGIQFEDGTASGTLCSYVVSAAETLVIPDTLLDPRFRNHPAVVGAPHLRFYAGTPIISTSGAVYGTICVVDVEPHELRPDQVRALETVARRLVLASDRQALAVQARETAERLHDAEERARLALEGSGSAAWELRLATSTLAWSRNCALIYGRPAEQISSLDQVFACIHPQDREGVTTAVSAVQRPGDLFQSEFRALWPDGSTHWIVGSGSGLFDEEGRLERLLGVNRDITSAVLSRQELQRSESRARRVLSSIGDAVIVTDENGHVLSMNPVAQQLTGWKEAEALGEPLVNVFCILNEHTRLPVEDPADKVRRAGGTVGMARYTLLIAKDGREIAIDDSSAPVLNEAGEMSGMVLVFRDISKRRRAENNFELLSVSGRILGQARDRSAILSGMGAEIARSFADFAMFDLLQEDDRFLRYTGPHRDPAQQATLHELSQFTQSLDLPAHPVYTAFKERSSLLLSEVTEEVLRGASSSPEEFAFYRDRVRPGSVIVVPMYADERAFGVITFVRGLAAPRFDADDLVIAEELTGRICTALHNAQIREELRSERVQLEAIVQTVPVGLIVAKASGELVRSNEEAARIFRHATIPSATVDAYTDYVAFHPDGRQVQGREFPLARAIAEGRAIRDEHYVYQKGDGAREWVSFSAAPIRDRQGRVEGGVVAVSDIDDLVKARQEAKRSAERTQLMMDRASVGVAIGDMRGGLSYANDVLLRWIGYTTEELQQGEVRWDQLTPSEYSEKDVTALEQLTRQGYCTPYEKVYVAKDGHWVPMLVGAVLVPSLTPGEQDGHDVAVFLTNLSLQKKAEAALLQTEKLTAVGRLASSISHEINNPLEAVTNLLYIVRNDATLSQVGRDYLDAADRELARVSQITSQTLRFHRQSTAATLVNPQILLEEVLPVYKTRLDHANVQIVRDFDPEVAVTCYEGDVRQVLNNFVNNALAAMPLGGRLRLKTCYASWWPSGQKGVRITVADTGTGMSDKVRARIFEAFFTTKGIHGTGLGLWISQRIVHKHRGHTRVRTSTRPGAHGTVITLWLPLELASSARDAWYADEEPPSTSLMLPDGSY